MKVEKKFLDRARALLEELDKLEEAKDVLTNYDSKVQEPIEKPIEKPEEKPDKEPVKDVTPNTGREKL